MMRKIYLFLIATLLFSVNIFAADNVAVAEKKPFHLFDAVGPVITYSLLSQSSCLTTRTFTATITDVDGVNTIPGTRPRVYYQRVGEANTVAGWKYTEATNASSPFTFVIDYSLLPGGVVSGNTIQYFVVAQDLNGTPNVSVNSGSFAAPPSSVALTSAAFPIGCCSNIYSIVNDLGTYITVGPSGDYTAFTTSGGLFSSINNVGLSGNTIVEIVDNLVTENNAFPLNQIVNTGCAAGSVSLIIKPKAGFSPIITGSVNTNPIIRILSSNVTIDGSNNGTTSRDLTLRNTNAISPNVIIYGSLSTVPISNSTLKNTICNNGANLAGTVVVSDGAVGGNPGYFNSISIQNNSIQKGLIGVLCAASPGAGNGSILVTGNDINSAGANQIGLLGIYTEGVDGAVVSNNNIGNFEPAATGPRYGIHLNSNTINSTVSGNIISGISYSGSGVALTYGINITPAVTASGNNITGNTISNISSGASSTVFGINVASASGGITIQKNNVSNIKNTNGGGYGAYGIGLSSTNTTANITVANNFIYDVAGFGVGTLARNGYGIYLGSGGGYKIYYNSVNMNTNQGNTVAGASSAFIINGVITASSLDIRNNIFANTQTGGTPAAARYAIYCSNANTIFSNIDNNDYYTGGTNLGYLGIARTTLANIVTGFGGNTNAINVLPNFFSSTDLHLTTANCGIDNRGTPVSITTDIDATTRDVTTPDMGADEFTAAISTTLASGAYNTSVCENKTVSASGTSYVTNACNLIAKVLPSGGATAVTGIINVCATFLDPSTVTFNGEPYVERHHDIEPVVTPTTATATVTLYFTDLEFTNYNTNHPAWPKLPTVLGGANTDPFRANVRVTQFHGTPTLGFPTLPGNYTLARVLITPGAANVVWSGNYWEVTFPVTGFSGFYLHTTLSNFPLPIAINYLTGRKQGSDHLLNWKVTCNSSPRATMVLQRSADSRSFSDLYSITADALRCNQPFDYTDTDPLKGINYYRLKVTDADGKIWYSTLVALLNAVKGFEIISIAPNPVVNDNFKLNVASALAGKMEIIIFDMQGRLVNRQSLLLVAGFNSLPVNVGNLSSGTYTIRAGMTDEQAKIIRFVKQ
jgi:hypothetical protein